MKYRVIIFFTLFVLVIYLLISKSIKDNKKYPYRIMSYNKYWKSTKIDSIVGNKLYFHDDYGKSIIVSGNFTIEKR